MWYIFNNYASLRRPFIESLQFGDNIGNTVFLEASETLFNATPVNIYGLNESEDLQSKVKSGDGVILCMANCLSQYWKSPLIINLIKKLNLNVLVFSVGIQSQLGHPCSYELSDDVKELLSLTRYPIYVRGKTSSDFLNSKGIKNQIIGCPSIFNAKPIIAKTHANTAFQCTFTHSKEFELLKFGIKNNFKYIIQSEKNLALMSVGKPPNNTPCSDLTYFNKLTSVEKDKFKSLLLFPTALSEWKDMLKSKHFLITTRIHGALLALEVGVLPLLIIVDERTNELAQYHSIPSINIDNCKITDISVLYKLAVSQIEKFNNRLIYQKERLVSCKDKIKQAINCFQYWDKGIDKMPPMIRYIYDHNLTQSEKYNFNLILITDQTVKTYFEPCKQFFSLASNFRSDIVRYNVLNKYGGIWLDTDIIIIKNLNVAYHKFFESKYDTMVDTEYKNNVGCASIFMKANSVSSKLCLKYVNDQLDSNRSLKWGDIGPDTMKNLIRNLPNQVLINDNTITSNGCNFISWVDNPGYNKDKWIMDPTKAAKKASDLLNNPNCYYVITWTIYRKHDIKSDITDFVFKNPNSVFTSLAKRAPSFNVLIATVGRPSLQKMINSLRPQLSQYDCLTVVFDGHSTIPSNFDFTKFKCKINLFNEPTALKYWGHGIRNKYSRLLEKRDFVMHGDDDDTYHSTAFQTLRTEIYNFKALYVYKFLHKNKPWPAEHKCIEGHIGTPSGIIPYELNKRGTWLNRFGGDGSFYEQIKQQVSTITFSDKVIYIVRPSD